MSHLPPMPPEMFCDLLIAYLKRQGFVPALDIIEIRQAMEKFNGCRDAIVMGAENDGTLYQGDFKHPSLSRSVLPAPSLLK